jgi:peroxiredoxin-like protein
MEQANYFQVKVLWKKDRKGILSSPDLQSKIDVATPPDFPKGIAGVWSPEHLMIAAVNSCLMTTFLAIAENSKFEFINFESNASGKLEKVDGKYMITEITLSPIVSIANAEEKEKAERILQKAEAACIISNSIKSKIIFQTQVKILFPSEKSSFDLCVFCPHIDP